MLNYYLRKYRQITSVIFFITLLAISFFSHQEMLNILKQDIRVSSKIKINAFYSTFLDNLLGYTYTWQEGWKIEGTTATNDLNGNSYFSGTIYTDFGVRSSVFLGKLNATKKIVWMYQWDFFTKNIVKDIIFDKFNNQIYILGDVVKNSTSSESDILLLCIEALTGQLVWNTTIGDANKNEYGSSIAMYFEGIFISSTQTLMGINSPNIVLYCLYENGTINWLKTFETNYQEHLPKLIIDEGNQFIYLGFNRYFSKNGINYYHFFIQKMTINGTLIWEQNKIVNNYTKINDLCFNFLKKSIVAVGVSYENTQRKNFDIIMLEYNSKGELLIQQLYGKKNLNEIINSIQFIPVENSYFLAGYGDSEVRKESAAFLSNIKANGQFQWLRKTNRFKFSSITDIALDINNKLIIIGSCKSDYDIFFPRALVSITEDSDYDSLSNYWEIKIGTDPNKFDTDGDGYSDAQEYFNFTDPLNPQSNPQRRLRLRNFGFSLAIIIIISYFVMSFILSIKKTTEKEPPIIKIINSIRFKRKNNS